MRFFLIFLASCSASLPKISPETSGSDASRLDVCESIYQKVMNVSIRNQIFRTGNIYTRKGFAKIESEHFANLRLQGIESRFIMHCTDDLTSEQFVCARQAHSTDAIYACIQ